MSTVGSEFVECPMDVILIGRAFGKALPQLIGSQITLIPLVGIQCHGFLNVHSDKSMVIVDEINTVLSPPVLVHRVVNPRVSGCILVVLWLRYRQFDELAVVKVVAVCDHFSMTGPKEGYWAGVAALPVWSP